MYCCSDKYTREQQEQFSYLPVLADRRRISLQLRPPVVQRGLVDVAVVAAALVAAPGLVLFATTVAALSVAAGRNAN